jgi:Ca2+:H+ antiporter
MPRWLYFLLLCGVAAVVVHLLGGSDLVVFALAAIGIIPVSGLIGQATEELAHHVGPKFGGLLNATFGNAAELIIGIVALRAGLLDLVKASITGSIIGNLLLVLGMGFLVGGIKHGIQVFDPKEASRNAVLLLMALSGLLLPAALSLTDKSSNDLRHTSVFVAIVLMAIYAAYIGYSFTAEGQVQLRGELVAPYEDEPGTWSVRKAVVALLGATLATVVLAELLVGTVEHVSDQLGFSEFFVGIIIVPIIGNVAEHFSAVQLAARNKPDVTQAIAAGSSTQVALFVAPLFVLLSSPLGHPMDLVFEPLEITIVAMAGFLYAFTCIDGETNWLEALELLGLYVMAGVVFFFLQS